MIRKHAVKVMAVAGSALVLGGAYAADAALVQPPSPQAPATASPTTPTLPAGPAAVSSPSSVETGQFAALGRSGSTSDRLPTAAASTVTQLGAGANPNLARQVYSDSNDTAYLVPAANDQVCLVVDTATGTTAGCAPATVAAQKGLYSSAPSGPGGAEDIVGVAPRGVISVTGTTAANQVAVTQVNGDGGYHMSTPAPPTTLRQTWPDHNVDVPVAAPPVAP